jgi:hypothetical protein
MFIFYRLLDWEDDLPADDFEKAEDHTVLTEQANGLAICLGYVYILFTWGGE